MDRDKRIKITEKSSDIKEKTVAHKNKIALIKKVKERYQETNNIRDTAKFFKMSRCTIKRYLFIENIEQEAAYNTVSRRSILDSYKCLIIEKYNDYKKVTDVHKYLIEQGIKTKYSTLNHYIKKQIDTSKIISNKGNSINKKMTIVNRKDIINEVFNWKNNDDVTKKYIEDLKIKYPIISKYQSFYTKFKEALINQDYKIIEKIFKTDHKNNTINSFLENAKKDDYEAIINSSKYKINNGIVEGIVNKIKTIKRTMFGRCSTELLSKKVLYQSNNYH